VLARVDYNGSGRGAGLRGGTFRVGRSAAGTRLDLRQVRWCLDASLSGRIERSPGRAGWVEGDLTVITAGDSHNGGRIRFKWHEGARKPIAQIHGSLGGAMVAAQIPAP
jgi:hypothetical protein